MSVTRDIIAEGSAGLEQALADLWQQTQVDPHLAAQPHYILFKLGTQQSLIVVDNRREPFQFFHYDLMGRSATGVVRDIIAKFSLAHWGEKGNLNDVSGKEMLERNMASFLAADGAHSRVTLSNEAMSLEHAREKLVSASLHDKETVKGREHFGLFSPGDQHTQKKSEETVKIKPISSTK